MARRRQQRSRGLDQPIEPRRALVPTPSYDPESLGRLSDRAARFLGTWRFIGYMTALIVAWLIFNSIGPQQWRFDEFPFIFLTLALSLQASYAAPLILLAQNRQTDRDRVQYEQDRAQTERNIADTEYLTREVASLRQAIGDVATRDFLRSELRDLLDNLETRERSRGRDDGESAG
jgi:uncharacterized membrane protein